MLVSGASRAFFGAGSRAGVSSRGRLAAASLEVALLEKRGAKEVVREGTAIEDDASGRWKLTRAPCVGAEKSTAHLAGKLPG